MFEIRYTGERKRENMRYNQTFMSKRKILSDEDIKLLESLSALCSLEDFRKDARNQEEMMVDFVYTSAKIEGNTYDRIDTDNLLRMGVTAGGKKYSDAIMLVNLRLGFGRVMETGEMDVFDIDYLGNLHKTLMRDLLPPQEQGVGRRTSVSIGASSYTPLDDAVRLRTEVKFMLGEENKYENAFERAIHAHCNLSYLKFFRSGNNQTARLMQTAALTKDGKMPLFFSDSLIDKYQRATVEYYESGDYAPYVEFFKQNYELGMVKLVGPTAVARCVANLESNEVLERQKVKVKP